MAQYCLGPGRKVLAKRLTVAEAAIAAVGKIGYPNGGCLPQGTSRATSSDSRCATNRNPSRSTSLAFW
jgi:hypothetical protein